MKIQPLRTKKSCQTPLSLGDYKNRNASKRFITDGADSHLNLLQHNLLMWAAQKFMQKIFNNSVAAGTKDLL